MTDTLVSPLKRDYIKLLDAMRCVVRALYDETISERQALHQSFERAVEGFRSEKALLVVVDDGAGDPVLRAVESRGLTAEQVSACEQGESLRGVSSKLIRRAIADRRLQVVENPFFLSEADRTQAFEATQGEHYSALCAPVLDVLGRVRAAIYLSNAGHDPSEAYGPEDGEWLRGYTEALGHVFALCFDRQRGSEEVVQLRGARPEGAPELIGDSAETQELRRLLHEIYIPMAAAREPDPLLVVGETGTGKDLVAKYLHAYGPRASKPFVVVNCSEITDEMAAARFFGHTRGAFTGAHDANTGYFRAANGGVLFLDEIGELTPRGQATLLRAIDSWAVTPVGDTRQQRVDVFVVLATNRDLDEAVKQGGMRNDFYRRFNTHCLRLSPLRDRPWDVPPLVGHFIRHHERRAGKKILGLTQDALRAMVAYPWPGNVREVKKVCSKLITHVKANARVDRETLLRLHPEIEVAQEPRGDGGEPWTQARFRDALATFQRELILGRLQAFEHDVRLARESLGLKKTTFRRKAMQLGLWDSMIGKEERD